MGRSRTGALLPLDRVRAIRDGQTTRREVLEWLGPPLAVVRRGGAVRLPVVGVRREGDVQVEAASAFGPLAAARIGANDVVYLYARHELLTKGFGFATQYALVGSSADEHRDDRLWILVDGDTGVVKAHAHRRDGPPEPGPSPRDDAPAQATWGGGP